MDIIYSFLFNTGHVALYYLLPFVIVLGIMVFFHELGHFLMAKYFGVKVEKFALGFGPKIVGRVVGETEYSIRCVPLGGFVKMLGEDEEEGEPKDQTPEEAERAFNNKHPLKRMAIVAAGPFFNIVLAFLLFLGMYSISGKYIMTTEIGQVTPGSPAERAGILQGDVVLSVEGIKLEGWEHLKGLVHDQAGKPLSISVKRGDEVLTMVITPEETVVKNEFGEEIKSALIGIVSAGEYAEVRVGPLGAIREGILDTLKWIKLTFLVIIKLFQGVVSVKTVGGPIMIGQMTGELVQEDVSYLVPFMAIISVNLGILNLFPIPILDGGLIVFLLLELMVGKPLSIKTREIAQKIGLSLLILLMAVVFYNDILRLFK
jgi:regulator of sigma E protease